MRGWAWSEAERFWFWLGWGRDRGRGGQGMVVGNEKYGGETCVRYSGCCGCCGVEWREKEIPVVWAG